VKKKKKQKKERKKERKKRSTEKLHKTKETGPQRLNKEGLYIWARTAPKQNNQMDILSFSLKFRLMRSYEFKKYHNNFPK
jgi:hypothetical protein